MNQKGFTLVELVAVIVVLGILAAVAIPKFVDLKTEAEVASAKGIYGGAQAAAALNHAAKLAGKTVTYITTGATLVQAMEGTPDGWTTQGADLCRSDTAGDCSAATYKITVGTNETATVKAVLSKTGF